MIMYLMKRYFYINKKWMMNYWTLEVKNLRDNINEEPERIAQIISDYGNDIYIHSLKNS